MKKSTIDRIISNANDRRATVIGQYTYKANLNTGEILRCKTEDLGREWLQTDGTQTSGWEVVAHT